MTARTVPMYPFELAINVGLMQIVNASTRAAANGSFARSAGRLEGYLWAGAVSQAELDDGMARLHRARDHRRAELRDSPWPTGIDTELAARIAR